jgi:hypothetical protein
MDMTTAIRLVADDQRQSWPNFTDQEAVSHARNTVYRDTLDEPESELGRAYAMVLAD